MTKNVHAKLLCQHHKSNEFCEVRHCEAYVIRFAAYTENHINSSQKRAESAHISCWRKMSYRFHGLFRNYTHSRISTRHNKQSLLTWIFLFDFITFHVGFFYEIKSEILISVSKKKKKSTVLMQMHAAVFFKHPWKINRIIRCDSWFTNAKSEFFSQNQKHG